MREHEHRAGDNRKKKTEGLTSSTELLRICDRSRFKILSDSSTVIFSRFIALTVVPVTPAFFASASPIAFAAHNARTGGGRTRRETVSPCMLSTPMARLCNQTQRDTYSAALAGTRLRMLARRRPRTGCRSARRCARLDPPWLRQCKRPGADKRRRKTRSLPFPSAFCGLWLAAAGVIWIPRYRQNRQENCAEATMGQTGRWKRRWFELCSRVRCNYYARALTAAMSLCRSAMYFFSSIDIVRGAPILLLQRGPVRKRETQKFTSTMLSHIVVRTVVPCCRAARGEALAVHHLAATETPTASCWQRLRRAWHPRTGSPRRRTAETSALHIIH